MDRREHKRVPLDVLIHCQSTEIVVGGKVADVSLGGILVKTGKTFPRHEKLDVLFKVPGSEQAIEARVQVVRMEPGVYMALAFLNLPPESEKTIQQYIAAHSAP